LVATESEQLIPGRDTDCIPVTEILQAMRYKKASSELDLLVTVPSVEKVTRETERAVAEALKHRTLKTLVEDTSATDITTPTPAQKEAS
jgi:hypothetical protein